MSEATGRSQRTWATVVGLSAVLMWSSFALLTRWSNRPTPIPTLELMAITFAAVFGLCVLKWKMCGQAVVAQFRLPRRIWVLGVAGIFGNIFFYFLAIKSIPQDGLGEANLINYSWPMLIVLLSATLPGHRLRWWHLAGTAVSVAGLVALFWDKQGLQLGRAYWLGYLAALGSAVVWAVYSVLRVRWGGATTDAVGVFCGATALLAGLGHVALEETVWPAQWAARQWLALAGLTIGPVGLAYFTWDYGVRRGWVRVMAAGSFAIPLFSTLLLAAVGEARASRQLLLACALIVGGATLASLEMLAPRLTGATEAGKEEEAVAGRADKERR